MRLEAIALPLVRLALTEDIGGGDATTDAVVDPEARSRARIEGRQEGVLAGTDVAALVFRELDPEAEVEWKVAEGGAVTRGARVADITAKTRALLSGERVALNFLQHLSGIATLARAFVKAVEGTGVHILDTRKTTPGLRFLEKHAVRCGGALNHRFGLFDGVLIKDNHVRAAGGLKAAIERVRASNQGLPVVVEVRDLTEAIEAAPLGPDRLLLDNFTPSAIAAAVRAIRGERPVRARGAAGKPSSAGAAGGKATAVAAGPEIEVSGGIRLANVRDFAIPGVDYISVGALTHSAPALDLSLELEGAPSRK
jgi:nicotinate-nucleotide pyrophosphorylase (carboxylating)